MRNLILIIGFCLLGQNLFSQSNKCNCADNDKMKADEVFVFENGKTLAICGSVDFDKNEMICSEFILFECGLKKIINEWDGTQNCIINFKKDTLIIKELYGLAIGKGQQLKWVPYHVTKFYFEKSFLRNYTYFRNDLPKYSKEEIKSILSNYHKLTKKSEGDSLLVAAHQLFWGYISGSKTAEKYLKTFEQKFGPFDGFIAEDFANLWATYLLHKQ